MLQAYDRCVCRGKRIAATRARTALIGKVRKCFLRIWKGGAVKATVRAKVITIYGSSNYSVCTVMYIGPMRTVRGDKEWEANGPDQLASHSLSPLTL
jgi:hypothetical protein